MSRKFSAGPGTVVWKFIKGFLNRSGDESLRERVRIIAPRILIAGVLFFAAFPPPPPLPETGGALRFYSREGRELRRFRDRKTGSWTSFRPLKDYPDHLIRALLRAEDRRFGYHPGVDPVAILRATWQNITAHRVVSGASTIHQQLIRLHPEIWLPASPYLRKPLEAWFAVRLALWYSSDRVLESYLNLVPLKWNTRGIPAGARRILGRDIAYLSQEESVALSVLIRRSSTGPMAFRARYASLAEDLGMNPSLPSDLEKRIFADSPVTGEASRVSFDESSRAPHFVDRLLSEYPGAGGRVQTTISDEWNGKAGQILEAELSVVRKKGALQGAVVALERMGDGAKERFDTVIYVGSSDYAGEEGQVDGARASRNAGSTLKPFVYALAMEDLGLTPFSSLSDRELSLPAGSSGETYRPANYDLNYWGDMTLREALVTSRNIPVVGLASQIGVDRIYRLLGDLGMNFPDRGPEDFGPGIALGTTGTTAMDLARAYSVFVSGGVLRPLRLGRLADGRLLEWQPPGSSALFSGRTAFWITHILSDRETGRKAYGDRSFLDFPYDVAAKTGTSKDFRDSWTVGYTDRFVVAVWTGDFRGSSMNHISGVYGAGRIFHQVMRMLESSRMDGPHRWKKPEGWTFADICSNSGCPIHEQEECQHRAEPVPIGYRFPDYCQKNFSELKSSGPARRILSPSSGETYLPDPHAPDAALAVPLHLLGCDGCRYRLDRKEWKTAPREMRDALPATLGKHLLEFSGPDDYFEETEYQVVSGE